MQPCSPSVILSDGEQTLPDARTIPIASPRGSGLNSGPDIPPPDHGRDESGVRMGIVQPVTEVTLPHGTVSLTIDHNQGVLRIFADTEPHPRDWAGALMLADLLAGGGWDCLEDGPGVDVYEVRILAVPSELAELAS